jgi:hypothetical protein
MPKVEKGRISLSLENPKGMSYLIAYCGDDLSLPSSSSRNWPDYYLCTSRGTSGSACRQADGTGVQRKLTLCL